MSKETFTRKPFISKDGFDDNGIRAEVHVVVGVGEVISLKNSDRGNSTNVTFTVNNTKHDPSAWTRDEKILAKVNSAKDNDEIIHFRIETRRKPDIDREAPINELRTLAKAKDSVVKSLAAVKLEDEDEWTISGDAVTRLDEDPSGSGLFSAYDNSSDELKPPVASAPASNFNSIEPPPYITSQDGQINPGSIAVSVPLTILAFVNRWNREKDNVEIASKDKQALTKAILQASNNAQLSIYEDKLDKPDLSLGSHTRARALIFETIESAHPITEDVLEDDASLEQWRLSLEKRAISLWKWSIKTVKEL